MSVKQYLCGPCLEEERELEGVVYCRECEEPLCGQCKQDHERIKVSKHHKLCDLADVPHQEVKELLRSLIACSNHEKEEAVYLCKDHDTTCCNKCAMADHRKCDEVKVLSDIVHDIKEVSTGMKTALNYLQQQGESLLEHERKHEELVSEIENQALSSLQTIKKKLLDIYAQIENEVLSAIAKKKKAIGEKIKTNNEKSREFLNDVKQQSTFIEHVEKFGTNEHVVLLQRQLEKKSVCRLESTVSELEKSRSKSSFKCVEDTSFDSLLIEMKNSLRIEDFTCDVSETGSDTDNSHFKPYTERIQQLQSAKDVYSIPMFEKAECPFVSSCLWIDKYIVIYLGSLHVLLVIKENSESVLSKFKFHSSSLSVSKTGPTDMVITMPYIGKIAFAQLRYGNVHIVTELKTRVPYSRVTKDVSVNQYICMGKDTEQIDILNNDGTLLREISLSSDLTKYVTSVNSFCNFNAYNLMLLISNSTSDKLMAFNLNGETVYEYSHPDLLGPRQLAVDPSGNVYVTSYRCSIHQISPSGQYIRSLLVERVIESPVGICFNSTFDKFALIAKENGIQCLRVYTFT